MTQAFRMPEIETVDRSSPISFTFNGRKLSGYKGDTLASALLANDQVLVGRSFKYHRPIRCWSVGRSSTTARTGS